MNDELQKLRAAAAAEAKEPAPEETQGVKIARENRTACNTLSDTQRESLMHIAMATIYDSNVPSYTGTNSR